jgi:hypothetical protein
MELLPRPIGRTGIQPVVIINGSQFATLKAAQRRGWRDTPGMNQGHSDPVPNDSPAALLLTAICEAVTACELFEESDRTRAAEGTFYGLVTHEGGYNPSSYRVTGDTLHSFSREYRATRRFRFSG